MLLTLLTRIAMKMSLMRRRPTTNKTKQQNRLARNKSSFIDRRRHDGDGLTSSAAVDVALDSQHVVRKIDIDRRSALVATAMSSTSSSLDETLSSDVTGGGAGCSGGHVGAMALEYEAIERNWSRFVGLPMQVLLLVGVLCVCPCVTF